MSFAKIEEVLKMPNLIEIQKNSYEWFLKEGLKEVFNDVSGITDFNNNLVLDFVDYKLDDKPNYSVSECKERDATYAAALRVTARLLNKETGEIKESEVFMGDFPLMTESGTFVINGAERVIVSQLVRSPGVYYKMDYDRSGKELFSSTIIPNRGAWLEYENDVNDVFYVRIDKNRKIPITVFIRCLGLGTDQEILDFFGDDDRMRATIEKDTCKTMEEALFEIYRKLRPSEPPTIESAQAHINGLFFDPRRYDLSRVGRYKYNKKLRLEGRLVGQVLAQPVANPSTGELMGEAGQTVTKEMADAMDDAGVMVAVVTVGEKEVKIISNGMVDIQKYVDFDAKAECGINERVCYRVLAEILESAQSEAELKDALRARKADLMPNHITVDDIFATINYMNCLAEGLGTTDDIDHLGNRRIRSVGELLQNQFRIGFSRLERVIRERMTLQAQDLETLTPHSLINIRPVVAAIKEFFGSSPLSQFMDQNNPLSELTHKRRLSALGPGGLSRDRASFEVRDVPYTHYGRMCPIETPEGPNIGLISYLATFARINEYGFIETPYRRVIDGKVTDEIDYLTADEEENFTIAQANDLFDLETREFGYTDEDGVFHKSARVLARTTDTNGVFGEAMDVPPEMVNYMDVSPRQMTSVATSLIPFLEHDDANRALMGSNMQRQAVPLLRPSAPLVGTGIEHRIAVDSGEILVAQRPGVVDYVDGQTIIILNDDGEYDEYLIPKFQRSNQSGCINHRPIVRKGDEVQAGDVLADGPSCDGGELALGQNLMIAYMPWEGYNYEDAIIVSERVVAEDLLTSIHISEYEVDARDTKLGPEEITREIPNISEDMISDLDADGIIRVGAEVFPGDVLVGKVTPKGETELTAEERLLRAIFGEKAREVRDTSLKVPHGSGGRVIGIYRSSREAGDDLAPGVNELVRIYVAQKRKVQQGDKLSGRHGNKGVISRVLPVEDMPYLADGTPIDVILNPLGVPSRMNVGQLLENHLGWAAKWGWSDAEETDEVVEGPMYVATPVFDGATEEEISDAIEKANRNLINMNHAKYGDMARDELVPQLTRTGKTWLYDGRTGEKFREPITVGQTYILKLGHMVDDKIHARSTGPYSLITQQPLGGKAQFGGQRFGEMEVWALYAYGASNVLQEILTVKSDDTSGRVKSYEAIVKGENIPAPEVPESFKVLVKEMKSLCLNVELEGHDMQPISEDEIEDYSADQALYAALVADAKKTEDEEANAIDALAAELGDLMSGLESDLNTDLIGGGEEA